LGGPGKKLVIPATKTDNSDSAAFAKKFGLWTTFNPTMEKCGLLSVSFGFPKTTCAEKQMDNGGEKRFQTGSG
jgi:hypothetical protein